jgi:hypothetical protein
MDSDSEEFCQACIAGDVPQVESLLKDDAKLANTFGSVRSDHREFMHKQNAESGWTALHLAAHYGQMEVVKVLIRAGADLNVLSKNGEANTPLMAAVAGGQVPIVRLLVKSGADPLKTDANGKLNALKLAELEKKSDIAEILRA